MDVWWSSAIKCMMRTIALKERSTYLNVLTMQTKPWRAMPKMYRNVGANTSLDVSNMVTSLAGFGREDPRRSRDCSMASVSSTGALESPHGFVVATAL